MWREYVETCSELKESKYVAVRHTPGETISISLPVKITILSVASKQKKVHCKTPLKFLTRSTMNLILN